MKKLWMIITALALCTTARAEYLYRAPRGTNALTAGAGYRRTQMFSDDSDIADPSTAQGLYRAGLNYDYGLGENLSLNVALTYTDLTNRTKGTDGTDETTHIKGIEPLKLSLRGRASVDERIHILYGTEVQIGLEKAKSALKRGTNRTIGDLVDGVSHKLTLTPYLGAALSLGAGELGAVVSYDIYKTDTTYDVDTHSALGSFEVSLERGARSVVTGYYEHQLNGILLGLDLGWIKQREIKVEANKFVNAGLPGFGMMRAEIYANIALSPTGSLIPALVSTSTVLSDVSANIDDRKITLAYRQTF